MNKNKPLEIYLRKIGEVELLTPVEEVELARLIRQNNQEALDKLVRSNLRFVVSVAKGFQNHGLSLDDLINEGNVGLIKAAHRFDETRGFKFISYAVWWIRQSILQAIAEKTRMIRLPVNRIGILTKINKVYSKLEQNHERSPTNEEIANNLDTDVESISNTIKKGSHVSSLDSPVYYNNKNLLMDSIQDQNEFKPDSKMMDESLKKEVDNILKSLTYRESQIIKLYFGLDGKKARTLEEVGVEFKITRERVRQIKEKALKKLQSNKSIHLLRQYLG